MVRQPVYLDSLPVVLVHCAPVGCVLPMNSTQEIQLNSMLGHPVLEMVEELTAVGQVQGPLVQLHITQTFSSFCCTSLAETKQRKSRPCILPLSAQHGLDTSICQQVRL